MFSRSLDSAARLSPASCWGIPAHAHTALCLSEVGAGLEKPSRIMPTVFARPTLGFWTSCLSPVLLAHCLLLQTCLFVPGRLLFPTEQRHSLLLQTRCLAAIALG